MNKKRVGYNSKRHIATPNGYIAFNGMYEAFDFSGRSYGTHVTFTSALHAIPEGGTK